MGLVYHYCGPASAHSDSMPVRLHRMVADARDLPGLARFRTQAPGWEVLCAREGEIVTGTYKNAAAGLYLMPATDPKTVKNRLYSDLTSSAQGPGPSGQPRGKPVLHDTPEGNAHPGKARARQGQMALSAAIEDVHAKHGDVWKYDRLIVD